MAKRTYTPREETPEEAISKVRIFLDYTRRDIKSLERAITKAKAAAPEETSVDFNADRFEVELKQRQADEAMAIAKLSALGVVVEG